MMTALQEEALRLLAFETKTQLVLKLRKVDTESSIIDIFNEVHDVVELKEKYKEITELLRNP